MRFMVFVIPNKEDYLAGKMPPDELFAAMTDYNEQLIKAGIMKEGECDGMKPTSERKRIAMDGDKRTVIDGPFKPVREQATGYWIWDVKDMDEAIMWAKRCPNTMPGPSEIEICPCFEPEDFQ